VNTSTALVHDLLAALEEVPGLHPATLVKAGQAPWGWNWDALAIDVTHETGGGATVVVRVVATRLPLPPLVRRAEQALLAVLATSHVPVTRLRLEVTDIDNSAFGSPPVKENSATGP
jgi:hypothetical protein